MSLLIDLPPQRERLLREEAARHGQAPEEFACGLLDRVLPDPGRGQRVLRFFEQARASAASSGLSEEELAEEVRLACEEARTATCARLRSAPGETD